MLKFIIYSIKGGRVLTAAYYVHRNSPKYLHTISHMILPTTLREWFPFPSFTDGEKRTQH